MGLPFTGHHAGQILFGPQDGYMYFMMGDGGNRGDPYNFAQNRKSLLGKIMRFDVNILPSKFLSVVSVFVSTSYHFSPSKSCYQAFEEYIYTL